jgi:membrane-bound lytic murein transglycosylase D
VDSALAAEGMPASLRYLPFIESGYNPSARSRAAAVGMWQFMEGTAGDYGMEGGPLLDERRDPFKSTSAAVRYLSALYDEFGSWFLTLAAYNGGPGRTRRIVRRHAPLAQTSDSLFWALRGHFPRETRDFVPKLIGAIVVASAPQRYGHEVERGGRLRYDEVEVPDATTLDVVARAAGTSLAEVEGLNPQLLRGITPPGRRFTLRVPEGLGAAFATNYAAIPPAERVSFVEHRVVQGETLSHIARRYRISIAELEAANPSVRARYLRVGARLTVPLAPSARRSGG